MTAALVGLGVLVLLVLAVAAMVLRRRVVVVSVSGFSMMPTLNQGDRIVVRRLPVSRARRGDVVVLRESDSLPGDDPTGAGTAQLLVKRVVAVPGDPEPDYLPDWARGGGTVPADTLVVLGDNRPFSRDSRHFGTVSADRLLGVAVRVVGGGAIPAAPAR